MSRTPDRDGFAFDHTSIGVVDALEAGRVIRRELGGTIVIGQDLPDFRYGLFHVGDVSSGGGIEVISPRGADGFMHRFLHAHGEAFHHVTFTVPDVEAVRDAVVELGLRVTSVTLDHPPVARGFHRARRCARSRDPTSGFDIRFSSPDAVVELPRP